MMGREAGKATENGLTNPVFCLIKSLSYGEECSTCFMAQQRVTDDFKWTVMYYCGQGASIIIRYTCMSLMISGGVIYCKVV